MSFRLVIAVMLGACALMIAPVQGAYALSRTNGDVLQIKDGDCIAFVGNTFVARERDASYLETALLSRLGDRHVKFRNLGWSGDTVFGDARALFGTPQDGFNALKKNIDQLKPDVVLVSYGMGESFGGADKLPAFVDGLNRMLDMLGAHGARLALISPIRHENLGTPLPDPTEHNRQLALYVKAMADVANRRGIIFVDLFHGLIDESPDITHAPLTNDGIHLTPLGYWVAAQKIAADLGYPAPAWQIEASARDSGIKVEGAAAAPAAKRPANAILAWNVTESELPAPPPPAGVAPEGVRGMMSGPLVRISGLEPGTYALTCEDRTLATADAAAWAAGVHLADPASAQAEQLRRAIVAKDEDYFNRWRPENDTYIYGFRQHEQGRHAADIPRYDPMIARKETHIDSLRQPRPFTLALARVDKSGK